MASDIPNAEDAAPIARRLATIVCADVAGYSQMMGANEERTVRVFRGHREIFENLVNLHRGRIFNTAGDALLAEFSSAVEAVRCATEIQAALATRNEHLAPEERMLFRIGINLGDVIIQGGDLLGDGVNVAARIQTATAPGGVCISGSVYDQIQNKLSLGFKSLGEQSYKNIARPVRTYTVTGGATVATAPARKSARTPILTAVGLAAVAAAGYIGYRQYDAQREAHARVEAELATQRQATEQATRATEDARREAQLQAQKLAADESLRRAQEERARLEQDRERVEADKRSAEATKRQLADETLKRAQEERARVDQERARLEADRQAMEAAKKATAVPAKKLAGQANDGTYVGQLCNNPRNATPNCWSVELGIHESTATGKWISARTKKDSTVKGTVASDGAMTLELSGWARDLNPIEGTMTGRATGGSISAAGTWRDGSSITGNWKRVQ